MNSHRITIADPSLVRSAQHRSASSNSTRPPIFTTSQKKRAVFGKSMSPLLEASPHCEEESFSQDDCSSQQSEPIAQRRQLGEWSKEVFQRKKKSSPVQEERKFLGRKQIIPQADANREGHLTSLQVVHPSFKRHARQIRYDDLQQIEDLNTRRKTEMTLSYSLDLPQEAVSPQLGDDNEYSRMEQLKRFSIRTPVANTFNPRAPTSWILDGNEPSREYLAENYPLFCDIISFDTNPVNWKRENKLEQLPFYAKARRVKVLMCTWNVNQGVFSREEIDKWTQDVESSPDIVCCGLEELEMSFDAIITGKKFSEKSVLWDNLIFESINRFEKKYFRLGYYQLCGVVLYVFFHERMENHIEEVGFADCRVGAMSGKLANKGGVAYRMKVYDSTISFVGSHLAAHQQFWEKRNSDWAEIAKMKIPYFNGKSLKIEKIGVLDNDVVVWMGDLNYRIEMTDFDVRKNLKSKNLEKLRKHDQLLTTIKEGKAFKHFEEGLIEFMPTFKICIGEGTYKGNRIPSWCDRVLWKIENRHNVECVKYTSHELYPSDHKPVTCLLDIDVQEVDDAKQKEVEFYLNKVEQKYRDILIPNVSITPQTISVQYVELFKKFKTQIELKNKGKIKTKYKVEGSVNGIFSEDWLTLKNCEGTLNIFEGLGNIKMEIEVCISQENAWMYQDRNMLLKKITIVFGTNEKVSQSFTVQVKTPPSVIGMRLESLNRMPRPMCGPFKKTIIYTEAPFLIPKEIFRTVDHIVKHYTVGCFTKSEKVQEDDIYNVITKLNKEEEFDVWPLEVFCESLLLLLSALSKPVGYFGYTENEILSDSVLLQQIRFMIPDEYRRLFTYIVAFLKDLVSKGEDENNLINRFAPHLFRCYNKEKVPPFVHFLKIFFKESVHVSI
ncbi:type II inositol-1,4,5-trisphosphate 5-phosphatase precursor, putative [Entamoeba invadens IP1]|uniref:Type II inositol-1,4,5-trisphosphate 5-phosphatase, putative n=1 Tax=Entamoeba invadens IP1 TaxID=370355 RepID=A0A0A1U140_ENTIV|nr:type II inositol-1,4,5-trisphosphate 5-phosphatase precursor, putative [Entamoeba invadens IP1]ELP87748.1 type II inositol-1,4,5-trisphosphate 5-phosphatase precursor, putative [Entamoeba invadens IP1]|eukprot:XP_004254519.1 type II inositol-1,4,5-trisphosphate 5-phosphatase precursor, putative [Entamoeba invadens IP1]